MMVHLIIQKKLHLNIARRIAGLNICIKRMAGILQQETWGLRHSKGIYILPLDADDKISSGFLERAVKIIESDNEIKLVCAETQLFGDMKK